MSGRLGFAKATPGRLDCFFAAYRLPRKLGRRLGSKESLAGAASHHQPGCAVLPILKETDKVGLF
jgi:hypothetical protein